MERPASSGSPGQISWSEPNTIRSPWPASVQHSTGRVHHVQAQRGVPHQPEYRLGQRPAAGRHTSPEKSTLMAPVSTFPRMTETPVPDAPRRRPVAETIARSATDSKSPRGGHGVKVEPAALPHGPARSSSRGSQRLHPVRLDRRRRCLPLKSLYRPKIHVLLRLPADSWHEAAAGPPRSRGDTICSTTLHARTACRRGGYREASPHGGHRPGAAHAREPAVPQGRRRDHHRPPDRHQPGAVHQPCWAGGRRPASCSRRAPKVSGWPATWSRSGMR